MVDSEIIDAVQALREDDIIIAFMGVTGSGKSYFIDLLTGQLGGRSQRSGAALETVTTKIQATRVKHHNPRYKDRLVLLDTPGFDDTTGSDMEVLTMISEWLKKTYERDVKLTGLIYLQRISDNRMAGSQLRNLRMFGELCGDVSMNQVILVSNMWQKVKPEVGAAREDELKTTFWKPLIDRGSRIERLKDADQSEAWRIVEQLIKAGGERQAVLLQEELVELQKKLSETEAGRVVYDALQKVLDSQREVVKLLLARLEGSSDPDPSLMRELKKEQQRVQQEFQKTFEQAKKQKISLGRRIIAFFFGKRSRAKVTRVVGS